jgi:hypothetical protein
MPADGDLPTRPAVIFAYRPVAIKTSSMLAHPKGNKMSDKAEGDSQPTPSSQCLPP